MEKFQLNVDTTSCIRCGKCVKVCPSMVLQQESKNAEVRIVEAAHYAPTAHNNQQVAFTLVTDLEKLRQIADYTLNTFRSVVRKLNNPLLSPILRRMMPGTYHYLPTISHLIQSADEGHDVVLRHATAVLFIHTPQSNFFGATDANLAYQNASLMAECLGVGHFYTGLICLAIQQDKKIALPSLWGSVIRSMPAWLWGFQHLDFLTIWKGRM